MKSLENLNISLNELAVSYSQLPDHSDDLTDLSQEIKIFTRDAGGGIYFVIKTERWAFDSIEDFVDLLKDFQNRLNVVKND